MARPWPLPESRPRDLDIKKSSEFAIPADIIHQKWVDVSVKGHKELKVLKRHRLSDHISEATLIFMALAELPTNTIAQTKSATGMDENTVPAKRGGKIAKGTRAALRARPDATL